MHSSISLALLVIVAGMFLLAKTSKDNLGKFFKIVSYFVIISGFLVIFCSITYGIVRMKMRHECKSCNREMFMNRGCEMMMHRHFGFRGNDSDNETEFHHHHDGFTRNGMETKKSDMDSSNVKK